MVNNGFASITCGCGKDFQVLRETPQEDGTILIDWDEAATAKAYQAHLKKCGEQV